MTVEDNVMSTPNWDRLWIVVVSGILLKGASTARAPDRAVVPQW